MWASPYKQKVWQFECQLYVNSVIVFQDSVQGQTLNTLNVQRSAKQMQIWTNNKTFGTDKTKAQEFGHHGKTKPSCAIQLCINHCSETSVNWSKAVKTSRSKFLHSDARAWIVGRTFIFLYLKHLIKLFLMQPFKSWTHINIKYTNTLCPWLLTITWPYRRHKLSEWVQMYMPSGCLLLIIKWGTCRN